MPPTRSICGLYHPLLVLFLIPICIAITGCEHSALPPESVFFDSASSSLSAGAVNALNGTYGTSCIERSGSWTIRVGSYAGALENPELSVVHGNSACVLSLDSVDSGNSRFLPVSTSSLSGSYAASALAFKQEGDAAIAFYANFKLSDATFSSRPSISLHVSGEATRTSAGSVQAVLANELPDGFDAGGD